MRKEDLKMKKILAILLVMMMSITVCSAEVVLFPDGKTAFGDCFVTSDTWNEAQTRVKYDETTTDTVVAYNNADGKSTGKRTGTITFPEAYTADGTSLEFTIKANSDVHGRAKIYLKDSAGEQIKDLNFKETAEGSGMYKLMNSHNGASGCDGAYYVSGVGTELRVKATFDFTAGTLTITQAKMVNDEWNWGSKAYTVSTTAKDFKILEINNEGTLCDASFYDFKVTTPKVEIPDVFENAIYKRVYKEDFSNGAKGFAGSEGADSWVKYDKENENIHAYNTIITNGSNAAKIFFDQELTENGTKIAFTYNTTMSHKRMKIHFMNSKGEKMHSMNVILTTEGTYAAIAENMSQISYSLYKAEPGVPVRVEMSFNFTDRTVTYRTGWITENGYEYQNYSVTTDYNDGAAATKWDIKELQISNEWNPCDATIDDVEVYVPRLSFVKSEADQDNKKVSYEIKNNTGKAITGDIICAVYGEGDKMTEVKIIDNATIGTTENLIGSFDFITATDFTKYAIYVWSDIGEMIPISLGYESF